MRTIDGKHDPRGDGGAPSAADRFYRFVFLALCAVAFTIAAMAALAPNLGGWARELGSGMCHQRPERTITGAGGSMGLCARCVGIYGGFAAVGAIYLIGRRSAWYGHLARASMAAPAVLGLELLAGWQTGNAFRLVLGVGLGLWLGFAVNWLLRN